MRGDFEKPCRFSLVKLTSSTVKIKQTIYKIKYLFINFTCILTFGQNAHIHTNTLNSKPI